jgi:hypothetical protein
MQTMRCLTVAATLLCFACSSDQGASGVGSASATPSPLYLQVSHYATQIAEVSKTICDCVAAESRASAEHIDTSFMTDKEIGICGGDNSSVDSFLSFNAPDGFANTEAKVQVLKADLENHNADSVTADADLHVESADVASILQAFKSDLSATRLPQAVKGRILKRLKN